MSSQGGYAYCACRDCFEVTMTTGLPEHEMCHACRTAACDGESDCDAPHTYCEADTRSEEDIWGCSVGGKLASPIFKGDDARGEALAWGKENLSMREAGQASVRGWGLIQYCGACGLEF